MNSLHNYGCAVANYTSDHPGDYGTEVSTAEADVDDFKGEEVLICKSSCDSLIAMKFFAAMD